MVIIARALNLKMAALHYVNVSKEVINVIKKIQLRRAQKMFLSLAKHFPKEKYEVIPD